MKKIEISINPFAEYFQATDKRKQKILSEQMDPDPVRIPYYQQARGAMSKYIITQDVKDLENAEKKIKAKIPEKNWQQHDRTNSIASLDKFRSILLPALMTENKLKQVRTKNKYLHVYGVAIKISPNAIYTAEINGQIHIGACKIHISKGKIFSVKQSKLVATIIYQFISDRVAEEDWFVDPAMCLCIDPFAGTTISANQQVGFHMREVKELCNDLPKIWNNAVIERQTKSA